jgi:hypothetical protein
MLSTHARLAQTFGNLHNIHTDRMARRKRDGRIVFNGGAGRTPRAEIALDALWIAASDTDNQKRNATKCTNLTAQQAFLIAIGLEVIGVNLSALKQECERVAKAFVMCAMVTAATTGAVALVAADTKPQAASATAPAHKSAVTLPLLRTAPARR